MADDIISPALRALLRAKATGKSRTDGIPLPQQVERVREQMALGVTAKPPLVRRLAVGFRTVVYDLFIPDFIKLWRHDLHLARLRKYLDKGLITEERFEQEKDAIKDQMRHLKQDR